MRVGMVGWRGMVGSVLSQRMAEEGDFESLEVVYFSTSQVGLPAPAPNVEPVLLDAHDLEALHALDVVITCQGGDYTQAIYPALRERGWQGYWIDAASTLRLADDAVVVLDPVNAQVIDAALQRGVRTLVGGNCTVSLLLMAIAPLIERGWVEWISTMTYQAASGAGAAAVLELAEQTRRVGDAMAERLTQADRSALEVEEVATQVQRAGDLPSSALGAPLIGNVLPWIDRAMPNGQTREEWKAAVECQRILDLSDRLPIDGVCVRVGAMRCHAQGLTMCLREDLELDHIESALAQAHQWIEVVPNTREATLERLHPAAVSGTLDIVIGRLRKLAMGPRFLGAFTVGDQLLWGAAEPLRRALRIVVEFERSQAEGSTEDEGEADGAATEERAS